MKTEWCEIILAVLILIFNYWNWNSQVIITILAAVLIVHAFMCKRCSCCCGDCDECSKPIKKGKRK